MTISNKAMGRALSSLLVVFLGSTSTLRARAALDPQLDHVLDVYDKHWDDYQTRFMEESLIVQMISGTPANYKTISDADYEAGIQKINERFASQPKKIYTLGAALQANWTSENYENLLKTRQQNVYTYSVYAGSVIAMTSLFLTDPEGASGYMQGLRYALAWGLEAGTPAVAFEANKAQWTAIGIRTPPVYLLHLEPKEVFNPWRYDEKKEANNLLVTSLIGFPVFIGAELTLSKLLSRFDCPYAFTMMSRVGAAKDQFLSRFGKLGYIPKKVLNLRKLGAFAISSTASFGGVAAANSTGIVVENNVAQSAADELDATAQDDTAKLALNADDYIKKTLFYYSFVQAHGSVAKAAQTTLENEKDPGKAEARDKALSEYMTSLTPDLDPNEKLFWDFVEKYFVIKTLSVQSSKDKSKGAYPDSDDYDYLRGTALQDCKNMVAEFDRSDVTGENSDMKDDKFSAFLKQKKHDLDLEVMRKIGPKVPRHPGLILFQTLARLENRGINGETIWNQIYQYEYISQSRMQRKVMEAAK